MYGWASGMVKIRSHTWGKNLSLHKWHGDVAIFCFSRSMPYTWRKLHLLSKTTNRRLPSKVRTVFYDFQESRHFREMLYWTFDISFAIVPICVCPLSAVNAVCFFVRVSDLVFFLDCWVTTVTSMWSVHNGKASIFSRFRWVAILSYQTSDGN